MREEIFESVDLPLSRDRVVLMNRAGTPTEPSLSERTVLRTTQQHRRGSAGNGVVGNVVLFCLFDSGALHWVRHFACQRDALYGLLRLAEPYHKRPLLLTTSTAPQQGSTAFDRRVLVLVGSVTAEYCSAEDRLLLADMRVVCSSSHLRPGRSSWATAMYCHSAGNVGSCCLASASRTSAS